MLLLCQLAQERYGLPQNLWITSQGLHAGRVDEAVRRSVTDEVWDEVCLSIIYVRLGE